MKNCLNCNTEYSDKDSFCMECGNKLSRIKTEAIGGKLLTPQVSELKKKLKDLNTKVNNIQSKPISITLKKGASKNEKYIVSYLKTLEREMQDIKTGKDSIEEKKTELDRAIKNILGYMKENEKTVGDIEKKIKNLDKIRKRGPEKTTTRIKMEKPSATHISLLEKKLDNGINSIKTYINENESTVENIQKKLNDVIVKEDLRTHHKKITFDTERLLAAEKDLKKLKSNFRSLLIEIKDKGNRNKIPSAIISKIEKRLKKRIDEQEEVITHLLQSNKKLKTAMAGNLRALSKKTILENVKAQMLRKHLTLQDKLMKKLLKEQKEKLSQLELRVLKNLEKTKDESSHYLENLNKKISKNVNLNSRDIGKLNKNLLRLKKNVTDVNKGEMESILKRLIKDEKVINAKIRSIVAKDKEAIVRAMNRATKVELGRLKSIRIAAQTSIDKEFEKLNQLRKESRAATRIELKKIENIRSGIQPTVKKDLKTIEKFKEKAHKDLGSIEEKLETLDMRVAKEIKAAARKVDVSVAKEVNRRLHSFEEIKHDAENKLRTAKDLIKNTEKRLGTEIINLNQKLNTLSNIQKSQEMEILNTEPTSKKNTEEAIKREKNNIIKSIEDSIKIDVYKKLGDYIKEKNHLTVQVNELKSRIHELEKSNKELMRSMKKELVREALNDIEDIIS